MTTTPSTFVTTDGRHVCVPYRPELATLIPHARELDYQGERMLVMPNKREENKLARNLGVHIPSPILTRYDWCNHARPPWEVQKTTAALLTENPRFYVLSTMGTGKTRAAMYAADFLLREGLVRRVLVSAPLSTLTPVWETEVAMFFPHLKVRVLHGSRQRRLRLLAEDADIYVINHHGVEMLTDALVARGMDVVIIDEAASRGLRNKQTGLWKAHEKIVDKADFAWAMTGSPTPKSPCDAWAQIRLLTPHRTTKTMAQFKDQTMRKLSEFRWVARPEANDVVFEAMQPSVRYTRDQVAEIPETTMLDRMIALEPEAQAAYKMLFDRMRALTAAGQSVTAVNEGVLTNKLLQVACGYVYTDARTVYELPADSRRQALDELLDEAAAKKIVFVPYVHALEGIAGYLTKRGHRVGLVHGGVSRAKRDLIFRGFQDGDVYDTLVAHPQCMAHGLTLTAADLTVWYAPAPDLETYEQANARTTRPGQTRKTVIAHLFGTPVERAAYARLKSRGKLQGILLEMFKAQALEY